MTESSDATKDIVNGMIQMLNAGDFDDYLKILERSVAVRRDQVQRALAASLCIGDQIRLTTKVKPALLAGIVVDITDIQAGGKITVRLRRTYSTKWRQGGLVIIPASLIDHKVV